MGGSSIAICEKSNSGLVIKGNVIEKGGGFVSCRSAIFSPPKNLSGYEQFQLIIEGGGRTLKFSVACNDEIFGLTEFIPGGLRWIKSFPTNKFGSTNVRIPFADLQPSIRAKNVRFPFKFNPSKVNRLQILHSKFGDSGLLNDKFKSGPIRVLIKSISVV